MRTEVEFETRVLSELNSLKEAYKESEQKRFIFEQRLEKKWDSFMNDFYRQQYQNQNKIQREVPDQSAFDYDDYEEFDENFPINKEENVGELELSIRKDLSFKLRLVIE